MSITDWEPALLPSIVEVFVDVFNAAPWNDRWAVDDATRRLRDLHDTPGFEGAALLVDGTLTAFVGGHRQRWWDGGDHCYIAEMAVRRSAQRSGHGTRLLRAYFDRLSDVSTFYLLTDIEGPAAEFYAAAGFRPARRRHVMTRTAPATS
ncbi:GNAT family N-acetyltransferase [Dactylosporangium cerinum]|uniref:GNAT family N-acetyltransferase n=1 Tax=Dactylosporangium cerinum TaxID=1434730 RepID=A0ABV9W446_9ACTN